VVVFVLFFAFYKSTINILLASKNIRRVVLIL